MLDFNYKYLDYLNINFFKPILKNNHKNKRKTKYKIKSNLYNNDD